MKINIKRSQERESQKQAHKYATDIFASMVNANLEAETVIMVAAKRFFGLGEKRMREFISCINEVKREYEEYRVDDVFGTMAKREFDSINIDIVKEMSEPETLEMAIKMYQRQIRPNISSGEAKFMQDSLNHFKKVVSE